MSTTSESVNTAAAKGWDVYMNDIHVGMLSDEQYQEMKRAGRKDPMNAVRQLLTLGATVLRAVAWAFRCLVRDVPVIVFWAAILLAIFSPQSYTDLPRDIDPESLRAAVKTMLRYGLLLALIPLTLSLAFSMFWLNGPRDVYADALQARIRKHFKLTTIGQLELHRQL